MSDETPTERLAEATEELAEERKRSSALMIALIVIGVLLLAGVVTVLVILLTRTPAESAAPLPTPVDTPSATPSESATPVESVTPSPTPTPTPTPKPTATSQPQPQPQPDNKGAFTSFSNTKTVSCNSTFPPGYTIPKVSFSYSTKNASSVWFIMGGGDAADAGAFPMPLSGNQSDVYGDTIEYPCGQASQKYTLTIVGKDGQHVSKTFTVKNTGDVY